MLRANVENKENCLADIEQWKKKKFKLNKKFKKNKKFKNFFF